MSNPLANIIASLTGLTPPAGAGNSANGSLKAGGQFADFLNAVSSSGEVSSGDELSQFGNAPAFTTLERDGPGVSAGGGETTGEGKATGNGEISGENKITGAKTDFSHENNSAAAHTLHGPVTQASAELPSGNLQNPNAGIDPETGLVELARPDGNAAGFTTLSRQPVPEQESRAPKLPLSDLIQRAGLPFGNGELPQDSRVVPQAPLARAGQLADALRPAFPSPLQHSSQNAAPFGIASSGELKLTVPGHVQPGATIQAAGESADFAKVIEAPAIPKTASQNSVQSALHQLQTQERFAGPQNTLPKLTEASTGVLQTNPITATIAGQAATGQEPRLHLAGFPQQLAPSSGELNTGEKLIPGQQSATPATSGQNPDTSLRDGQSLTGDQKPLENGAASTGRQPDTSSGSGTGNAQTNPLDAVLENRLMPRPGGNAPGAFTLEGDQTSSLAPSSLEQATSTTLRAGTPTPYGRTAQLPVNAVAVHVTSQAQQGARNFQIRLNPPELGRVEVKLDITADGKLTTHLIVERPETLDMFQRDAKHLERALADSGLDLGKDGVTFSLKDDGRASGQNGPRADGDEKGEPSGEDGDKPAGENETSDQDVDDNANSITLTTGLNITV